MSAIAGVPTEDFAKIGIPIRAELFKQDTIYTEASVMPSYIAGEDSLQRLIDSKRNSLLAEGETSDGIYEVTVSIVVEKDGTVRYKSAHLSCGEQWVDRKAFQIFDAYGVPRWHPGLINGEPVRVRIYRTVTFNRPATAH